MKMWRQFWMLSLIVILGLTACGGALGGNQLDGTAWKLISFGGVPPLPGTQPTLSFEDGQLGGNASCNSFGGEYQVRGDKIIFGELFWTLMACMDNAVMDQEQAYMQMLGGEALYEIADGQLVLTTAGGETMIFVPME